MHRHAPIALDRFGLGARPSDDVGADPRGWVEAQIGPAAAWPGAADLPTGPEALSWFLQSRQDDEPRLRAQARDRYAVEARARIEAAVGSDRPFVERWVAFWADHFTVSVAKGVVLATAGAFEREAVRPHAFGSFADLLLASTRHPAMLVYLDNARSTGPRSRAGERRDLGLNENLAREILELHTLGVDGGYSQDDVVALARLITGWSIDPPRRGGTGQFQFHARRHEPGPKRLLGVRYGEGEKEGERALRALAAHPSTARHVARKLARHFVADAPPANAIAALQRTFQDTGGDLAELACAVVRLDAAWKQPGAKVRSPWDLVVATARADGGPVRPRLLLAALTDLNQAPWSAPSPAGWPDTAEAWIAGEALMRRIGFAERAGERWGPDVDARRLAERVLGPRLQPATARALRSAPDRRRAFALLVASPEFNRR